MSIPQAIGVLAAWTVLSAIVGALVGNAIATPDDDEVEQ
jgi:hypothetical protein